MHADVRRVDDFEVDGTGSAVAWAGAEWLSLAAIRGPTRYRSRVKLLWSRAGLYAVFDCQDQVIRCTDLGDNDELYTQDVVELFLWPDASHPVYFEYELSPKGKELPLLVSNTAGTFMGWLPWRYAGDRRVKKGVTVQGGDRAVTGWTAEIFVPFALLAGLSNVPPKPGASWRANFYRIDYDTAETWFAWATGVRNTFHDLEQFGSITFRD